jgi:hypothetical protein
LNTSQKGISHVPTTYSQSELIELALRGIDAQIAELEQKKKELSAQIRKPVGRPSKAAAADKPEPPTGRRKMTAAGRAKLRAAAKARWAAWRQQRAGGKKTPSKKA